jgi:hypothetical protein
MSDTVWTALIGVTGSVVGSVATVFVARIQTAQKAARGLAGEKAEAQVVFGSVVDIRELRILRALFGEPRGRVLEAYQAIHYRAALKATLSKRWVKRIEGRYYLTQEGVRICREYLRELATWQPAAELLG